MKQTDTYGLVLYDKEDNFDITSEKGLNASMKKIDKVLAKKTNNDDIKALTNSEIESLLEQQV